MPPVRDAAAAGCGARRSGRGGASGIYNGRTHVGKFRWFGICAGLARDWNLSDILSRAMADTSAPATPFPAEDASPLASETAAPPEAWSAAPQEPVQEWQAESAPSDWQEARKQDAEAVPEAADTDWSSLRSGPDWSASSAPEQPQEQTWGAAAPAAEQPGWNAAAPAPVDSEWTPPAPAGAPEWSAPPAAAAEEWDVPITEVPPDAEAVAVDSAPPPPKPAWNQAAVGATALEQLDSQPPEPEPGAAKELFGSVPAGAMLGAADDELSSPGELAAPEEVLKPVAIDHDDPDLPQPTGEPARTRAQPLAAWRPTAANALA